MTSIVMCDICEKIMHTEEAFVRHETCAECIAEQERADEIYRKQDWEDMDDSDF